MRSKGFRALIVFSAVSAALCSSAGATISVEDLIIRADSLLRSDNNAGLSELVAANLPAVGTAVGDILNSAIKDGNGSDSIGEEASLALADRLAQLFGAETHSRALEKLVATYRGWDGEKRSRRREAGTLKLQGDSLKLRADSLLAAGKCHIAEAIYDEAADAYEQAILLYVSINDRYSAGIVWGSKGNVHFALRQWKPAIKCYERALKLRRSIDDRRRMANAIASLGYTCLNTRDYSRSEKSLLQAIAIRESLSAKAALFTPNRVLATIYVEMDRRDEAEERFQMAIDIARETGDLAAEIDALLDWGGAHYLDLGRSNELYEEALDLAAEGSPDRAILCHVALAENSHRAYRFRDALDRLALVEAIIEREGCSDLTRLLQRQRGVTYMNMGELDLARRDFVAGQSNAVELPDSIEALINLGYLEKEAGDYALSEKYSRASLDLAEAQKDLPLIREALLLSAQLDLSRGRYNESLKSWKRMLEIDRGLAGLRWWERLISLFRGLLGRGDDEVEGIGEQRFVQEDRMGMANIYAVLGKSEKARSIYRRINEAVIRGGSSELKISLLFGIGHTYETEDPDSARHYYGKALGIIEESGAQIAGTDLRTGFYSGKNRYYFEEVARFYTKMAAAGTDERWTAWAFETIERAKGRGLLSLLEHSMEEMHPAAESAVLDSLYAIDAETGEGLSIRRKLEERYIHLREGHHSSYDPARAIKSLRDVQEALQEGSALLEYALGDTVSTCWVITRSSVEQFDIPKRSSIAAQVGAFKAALRSPGRANDALFESASSLYAMLVEPVRRAITEGGLLVIIPDGVLFEIPFEALIARDANPDRAWREQPFLARFTSIVYAPSASIFVSLNARAENQPTRELVAFGCPAYAAFSPKSPGGLMHFSTIPQSCEEATAVARAVGNGAEAVFLGHEASEATCKTTLSARRQRVLHFATHGVTDAIDPIYSCIALCPDPKGDEDGLLYSLEILSSPMNADLVVASACGTGRGMVGRGEGVIGLSRAFLGAGARGVVASLWAVSDESTTELAKAFYTELFGHKLPAHEALNNARLKLLESEKYSHPYYWAPMVYIGAEKVPW